MLSRAERLLQAVENYLEQSGESLNSFGVRAANDPHLVARLRLGREVRSALETDIRKAIRRKTFQRTKET